MRLLTSDQWSLEAGSCLATPAVFGWTIFPGIPQFLAARISPKRFLKASF